MHILSLLLSSLGNCGYFTDLYDFAMVISKYTSKKIPCALFDFDKSIREKIATLHPKLILLLSRNGKTYQFLKLQVGSGKSPDQAQET